MANGYRDMVCAPPANLTAELARAKRRAELEAASVQAADQLAATRPAKQANSDAVAMSRYLAALGADIGPDRLNDLPGAPHSAAGRVRCRPFALRCAGCTEPAGHVLENRPTRATSRRRPL